MMFWIVSAPHIVLASMTSILYCHKLILHQWEMCPNVPYGTLERILHQCLISMWLCRPRQNESILNFPICIVLDHISKAKEKTRSLIKGFILPCLPYTWTSMWLMHLHGFSQGVYSGKPEGPVLSKNLALYGTLPKRFMSSNNNIRKRN